MASNESPLVSPYFDYTISDYTVTAVRADGARFPFRDGAVGLLDDLKYNPVPSQNVTMGSGTLPRAHTRTTKKPTCELSMPIDTARRFERFCGPDGLVTVIFTRQKPQSAAITDQVMHWHPMFGEVSAKAGDSTPVKVTGGALSMRYDVKNVLA